MDFQQKTDTTAYNQQHIVPEITELKTPIINETGDSNIDYSKVHNYGHLIGILRAKNLDNGSANMTDVEILQHMEQADGEKFDEMVKGLVNLDIAQVATLGRAIFPDEYRNYSDKDVATRFASRNDSILTSLSQKAANELFPYKPSEIGAIGNGLISAWGKAGGSTIAGAAAGAPFGPVGAVLGAGAGAGLDYLAEHGFANEDMSLAGAGGNMAIQGGLQAILPGIGAAVKKVIPYVSNITPKALETILTTDVKLPSITESLKSVPEKTITDVANMLPGKSALSVPGVSNIKIERTLPPVTKGAFISQVTTYTNPIMDDIANNMSRNTESLQFLDNGYIKLRNMVYKPSTPESNIIQAMSAIKANPGPLTKDYISMVSKKPGIDEIKQFVSEIENNVSTMGDQEFRDIISENGRVIRRNIYDAAKNNPEAIGNMLDYLKNTGKVTATKDIDAGISALRERQALNNISLQIKGETDANKVLATLSNEPVTNQLFKSRDAYINDFLKAHQGTLLSGGSQISGPTKLVSIEPVGDAPFTGSITPSYLSKEVQDAAAKYADSMVKFRDGMIQKMISTNKPARIVDVLHASMVGGAGILGHGLIMAHPIISAASGISGLLMRLSPTARLATLKALQLQVSNPRAQAALVAGLGQTPKANTPTQDMEAYYGRMRGEDNANR